MEGERGERHRLIFLGGLHRSGTTPLARLIASHPSVSGLTNTTVPEDEGEYLQSVYPESWEFGGVGRFALKSEMHLTESSALVEERSRETLWAEWSRWWDLSKPWLLEKSPPNMLKMRFLQALFPESSFVLIRRHPVAVVGATLKWWPTLTRDLALHRMLLHWVRAYEIAFDDAPHVHRFHSLRYEDFTAAPDQELASLSTFLGIDPPLVGARVEGSHNDRYFRLWCRLRSQPARRRYMEWIERRFEPAIQRFGYSFADVRSDSVAGVA